MVPVGGGSRPSGTEHDRHTRTIGRTPVRTCSPRGSSRGKVAVDSYVKMGEKHIDVTQAIFFPAHDLVHHLHAPMTPQQIRVFTHQVQACVWMLIEAAEA